jgi:hypothetical protein
MNHSQEIIYMVFVPNNQSSEILKPGKQALDLPSTPVTPQSPAILVHGFFSSFAMRCNHLNAALITKLFIKLIAVISFVANQFIRRIARKTAVYCGLNKLYLMGRSAFHVSGGRKMAASVMAMILVLLPRFVLPTARLLFLQV